jgi:protein-S-isoprenylcysteine O-methyltransferase Ste14
MNDKNRPTNTRRDRHNADRKLVILVIATLVIVGGGIIALVYGPTALIGALPCLLGGAILILGLWLLLTLLEKWRDSAV